MLPCFNLPFLSRRIRLSHVLPRCIGAHTLTEIYLKLQIAKKSKPLASPGRWDLDSRFSVWKTIHLLWHFACEGKSLPPLARVHAQALWHASLWMSTCTHLCTHVFLCISVLCGVYVRMLWRREQNARWGCNLSASLLREALSLL